MKHEDVKHEEKREASSEAREEVKRQKAGIHLRDTEDAEKSMRSAWIGLIEVRAYPGVDLLAGAAGALVNVIVWAADGEQYRELAVRELADSGFAVVEIQDAEPLADRIKRGARRSRPSHCRRRTRWTRTIRWRGTRSSVIPATRIERGRDRSALKEHARTRPPLAPRR